MNAVACGQAHEAQRRAGPEDQAMKRIKYSPILFSVPMVQAILEGRKTQTRRVIKPQPYNVVNDAYGKGIPAAFVAQDHLPSIRFCPHGRPGDLLWVREAWKTTRALNGTFGVRYRSDGSANWSISQRMPSNYGAPWRDDAPWCPSIFMPRWASRITLEIVDVQAERLQMISDSDAKAEGVSTILQPVPAFRNLWDSINAGRGYGWDANPWVWVIKFRRITP